MAPAGRRRTSGAPGERLFGKVCSQDARVLVNQVFTDLRGDAGAQPGRQGVSQQSEEARTRHHNYAVEPVFAARLLKFGGYAPCEALRLYPSGPALPTRRVVGRSTASPAAGPGRCKDPARPIGLEITVMQMGSRIRETSDELQSSAGTFRVVEACFTLIGNDDSDSHWAIRLHISRLA